MSKEQKIGFGITSEIGKLQRVMIHRPGKELERLTIDNKDVLLFDDIPWIEDAQKQHDQFAQLLMKHGVELIYFKDCLSDILSVSSVRRHLLDEVLSLEAIDIHLANTLKSVMMDLKSSDLAEILVAGITKKEALLFTGYCRSLVMNTLDNFDLLIRPLPNLYFQRDPYVCVDNGIIFSVMNFPARRREPLYGKYIFQNHPLFKGLRTFFGNEPGDNYPFIIEGGDILVLSNRVIAIGVSQRTRAGAIEIVGSRIARETGVRTVLAVDIPKTRSAMHLDTVFTMLDRNAFTIYPGISACMRTWELSYDEMGTLVSLKECDKLVPCLRGALEIDDILLIETGGGDPVAAAREQWNDGTNTFAIAPGEVVTYCRNAISNRVLREKGIIVHEIKGSELGRGRGGPRCMTMPLKREPLSLR